MGSGLQGLSRVRTPLLAALLLAAFLASLWQQLNSERTADRPPPPLPDPFDPSGPPDGEEVFFGGLQFFTGTRTTTASDSGTGSSSSNTTTEDLAAAGLRWGPLFPVVPVGEGSSGGGYTRNLLLLAGNGMTIGTLGFEDIAVTTVPPGGGTPLVVSSSSNWGLSGGSGPILLPGESAGPGVAPARSVNPARSGSTSGGGFPLIAPAPAPARVPLLPPAPGPAPAPATVPQTLPQTPATPVRTPTAVQAPTIPQNGQQLGPGGQLVPNPVPSVQITPPGSTFLPGGPSLPGNGPPPTPQGMANELGKLEKKLELALAPEGPLSLLQQLNRAIDQIENIKFLLETLFPAGPYTFADGSYQLNPVCDRDSEGNLVPPLEAVWTGGEGEVVEVNRKIDALAQLIQHHKDLKQPTCGGRGNGPGSNVTVHFESD